MSNLQSAVATEDRDLSEILPDEVFNHPDCFDSRAYSRWEQDVAKPALEAAGYEVGGFFSTDEDSFGPLVRAVRLTKDGATETYFYG